MILLALTYLAMAAFIAAVAARAVKLARLPVHLRWELYPVPHDANAARGGSVLENLNWWKVRSSPKHLGDLKVMAGEILLLDGVREHNRSLWLRSYPFHGGLYLLAGFLGLLVCGSLATRFGLAGLASALATVTVFVGVAGFALSGAGALGLLLRRLTDPALRSHSAPADFFNLICFCGLAALGLASFALVDRDFAYLRSFVQAVLALEPVTALPALVIAEIVAGLAMLVYIPLTHMSHFFTKWFTYHSVRWDDQVNRVGSDLEAKIQRQLGAKVTWAAAHVGGGDGRNWVDVATAEVKK
jgi:nitrate reductase gamma subunit